MPGFVNCSRTCDGQSQDQFPERTDPLILWFASLIFAETCFISAGGRKHRTGVDRILWKLVFNSVMNRSQILMRVQIQNWLSIVWWNSSFSAGFTSQSQFPGSISNSNCRKANSKCRVSLYFLYSSSEKTRRVGNFIQKAFERKYKTLQPSFFLGCWTQTLDFFFDDEFKKWREMIVYLYTQFWMHVTWV